MKIDLDRLRALGGDLQAVHGEFSGAEQLTDTWREAVGHDQLSDKLGDFSGNWNDTRENMLEGIKSMADLATQIADAFRDTDDELSRALTEAD